MILKYPRKPGDPPATLEQIAAWQREVLGAAYLDLVAGAAGATSRYTDDELEQAEQAARLSRSVTQED